MMETLKNHPIISKSDLTKDQIIKHILSVNANPKIPIELSQFIDYYIEEAEIEGVNYGYAISQMLNETGYLKFENDVKPFQCNYCGLGATGTISGLSFPDVKTGIMAHIQHLKRYASLESLKQPCVDPRFQYIQLGIAPNVEDLSGKWSVKNNYAQEILYIYYKIKTNKIKGDVFKMEIKQMFISNNRSHKNLNPRGIVAHSTSNNGATAMNHYNYFNGGYRGASCHIVVDWNEAIQLVPFNEQSWHAGGTANRTYIGIEICEPPSGDIEKFNKVWNNAIDVFKQLLNKFGWNADNNVFSHKYISDTYHETDHQDPYAFFEQYGKTWDDFINALKGQPTNPPYKKTDESEGNYMSKIYKNGSTIENVFADEKLSIKIGSLDSYEQCEAIGDVNGKIIVLYNTSDGKKAGFVQYRGGL